MIDGSKLAHLGTSAQPDVGTCLGSSLDIEELHDDHDTVVPHRSISLSCSPRSFSSHCNKVSERLEYARRQGHLRLRRLRGPTLLLGFLCAFVALAFISRPMKKTFPALHIVGFPFLYVSLFMLLMSLVPIDFQIVPRAVGFVAIPTDTFLTFWCARYVVEYIQVLRSKDCRFLGDDDDRNVPCLLVVCDCGMLGLSMLVAAISSFLLVKWLSERMSSQILLQRAWRLLCLSYLVVGFGSLGRCVSRLYMTRITVGIQFLVNALCSWALCAAASRYDIIMRVQSWLMSRGEAATAAAGVSEMLGGKRPEHVLAHAHATFSCVRADYLLYADMLDNTPNPELRALAQKSILGHVDAFVSHSWHDDPGLKLVALQSWCDEFRISRNREPTLWIDKYCIDQNSIEESLACLPIYLCGCNELLILCGSSYLKRLWCLIEIFVFLEMGGKLDNLVVLFLECENTLSVSYQSGETTSANGVNFDHLEHILLNFDSQKASCFTEYDTFRLQRVLQTTGSDKINKLVRDVFVKRHKENRRLTLLA